MSAIANATETATVNATAIAIVSVNATTASPMQEKDRVAESATENVIESTEREAEKRGKALKCL